jgi:hypothetical protein
MKLNKVGESVISFKNNNIFVYVFSIVFIAVGTFILSGISYTPTTNAEYVFGVLAIIVGASVGLFSKRTMFTANRATQQITINSNSLVKKEELNIKFGDVKGIIVTSRMSFNSGSRRTRSMNNTASINFEVILQTINREFKIYNFTKNINTVSVFASSFGDGVHSPPRHISSKLRELADFIGVPYVEKSPETIARAMGGVVNHFLGKNTNRTSLNSTNKNEFEK